MQIIFQATLHPSKLERLKLGVQILKNPFFFLIKKMPPRKRGHLVNCIYLLDQLGTGCTNLAEAHFVGATTLFSHLSPVHLTWKSTIGLAVF